MERAKDIRQNIGVAECGYREDCYPAADCHALPQHGEQAEKTQIKADAGGPHVLCKHTQWNSL
jgi:hypothetical protein